MGLKNPSSGGWCCAKRGGLETETLFYSLTLSNLRCVALKKLFKLSWPEFSCWEKGVGTELDGFHGPS